MVREEMMVRYPPLQQKYLDETGVYIVIYRLLIEDADIM